MIHWFSASCILSILTVIAGCSGSSNHALDGAGFVEDTSYLPSGLQAAIQRLQDVGTISGEFEAYRTDYLFGDRIMMRFSRLDTEFDDLCAALKIVHEIESGVLGIQQFRAALPKEWKTQESDETRYLGTPSWVSGEPKVDVFVLRMDPKDDYLYMYYCMFHVAA